MRLVGHAVEFLQHHRLEGDLVRPLELLLEHLVEQLLEVWILVIHPRVDIGQEDQFVTARNPVVFTDILALEVGNALLDRLVDLELEVDVGGFVLSFTSRE